MYYTTTTTPTKQKMLFIQQTTSFADKISSHVNAGKAPRVAGHSGVDESFVGSFHAKLEIT